MDSQDFDQYAFIKTFDGDPSTRWRAVFSHEVPARERPLTVLDFGCGDGRFFSEYLSVSDPEHIHGLEVSQHRVDRARGRGYRHVRVLRPGERLPYRDRYFDVINVSEVIEHVPRETIRGILAEWARVLAGDGIALVSTPNYPIKRVYDVIDAVRHGPYSRFRDDPTHVSRYSQRSLTAVLTTVFEEVRIEVLKEGLFYRRIARRPWLAHKMLAVCRQPLPATSSPA